jgi:8-oxo-dGTP pyrophosphatase MutT (NUDIX family)
MGGMHLFAYPVIESSDGALVAIRMGAHTANPGQVYFAAGSLEPEDIVSGVCDVEFNMRREVLEETGLDLADSTPGERYYASHFRRTVTVFRLFRFDLTADEIVERIAAHMLVAEDKEIAGAVAIRSADHAAFPYNVAMFPVIDWYFGNPIET